MTKPVRMIVKVVGAMGVLIIGFLINGAAVESMGPGAVPNFIIIVTVTLALYIAGFFSLLMGGRRQRQPVKQVDSIIEGQSKDKTEDKSEDKK